MGKFLCLLSREIQRLFRSKLDLPLHFIIYTITIAFITKDLGDFIFIGQMILAIVPLMSFIAYSSLFDSDILTGYLEILLSVFSPTEIIMSKYLSAVLFFLSALVSCNIVLILMYNAPLNFVSKFSFCFFLLQISCIAFALLSSIIKLFYSNSSGVLIFVTYPFIISNMIFIQITLNSESLGLVFISFGVFNITTSLALFSSRYLLKEVFIA